jgi:hypothetical protein
VESRQICRLLQVWVRAPGDLCLPTGDHDSTMGNYLDKNSRSLRRYERRPSYAHTAAPVLGPRAVTPGVAATTDPSVDVSSTASVAAPTGRVPGLRGAFIIASTPCSCVGIGDQHSGIVRLFEVV